MVAMAPPMSASPARTQRYLGRYELIGELARGGMGTVYLARHAGEAGFQRLFAIKVMHPHLADEVEFVDMLRDEARIAARIHHPNVVAIVDIGFQDDLHYVVMDYVEGPPFGTLIKRSGSDSVLEKVITAVIDTLEGLHAAHSLVDDDGQALHLVHRDVSPQNILVGADGVARITDFGIAKAETRIASTRPGSRKGKLAFMAPEQITNEDQIDLRADIWATGVVLWMGLTGRNLFKSDNDAATIHSVIAKPIAAPSKVGRRPPEFLDEVVMRALERDPEKRFGSALEMADALRNIAAQNGLRCSRQQVAKWVAELFGEELGLRRKAIRTVAKRRADQLDFNEASQITVLPALPGVTGMSGTGTGTLSGDTPISRSDHVAPVLAPSVPPLVAHADLGVTDLSDPFQQRKKRLILLGSIAAALAITTGLLSLKLIADEPAKASPALAANSPAEKSKVQLAAPTTPAPGRPEAQPSASTKQAEPKAVEDSRIQADEEVTADTKPESQKTRVRYVGRRNGRPRSQEATPTAEAPPPEPKEEAAATSPKPLPVPAATPGFEKNPYLRR